MFVKPLDLLFSNFLLVLVFSFVVGPYHQSTVKGGKEARSPCLCNRAHRLTIERTCNRACGPRSSAPIIEHVDKIERTDSRLSAPTIKCVDQDRVHPCRPGKCASP